MSKVNKKEYLEMCKAVAAGGTRYADAVCQLAYDILIQAEETFAKNEEKHKEPVEV